MDFFKHPLLIQSTSPQEIAINYSEVKNCALCHCLLLTPILPMYTFRCLAKQSKGPSSRAFLWVNSEWITAGLREQRENGSRILCLIHKLSLKCLYIQRQLCDYMQLGLRAKHSIPWKANILLLKLESLQLNTYVLFTTMKPQWGNNWKALSRVRWFSHVLQSKYHLGWLPAWRDLPALGLQRSQNPQLWGSTLGTEKSKILLSSICSTRHTSSSPICWLLWMSNGKPGETLFNTNHRKHVPSTQ